MLYGILWSQLKISPFLCTNHIFCFNYCFFKCQMLQNCIRMSVKVFPTILNVCYNEKRHNISYEYCTRSTYSIWVIKNIFFIMKSQTKFLNVYFFNKYLFISTHECRANFFSNFFYESSYRDALWDLINSNSNIINFF